MRCGIQVAEKILLYALGVPLILVEGPQSIKWGPPREGCIHAGRLFVLTPSHPGDETHSLVALQEEKAVRWGPDLLSGPWLGARESSERLSFELGTRS